MLTEAARLANFTNEGGVDGTIRFLRNVMGLWMLQECHARLGHRRPGRRCSTRRPPPRRSGRWSTSTHPKFLPPGDMPARIEEACRATGQAPPATRGETVRCILESLALAYRRTVRLARS